MVMRTKDQETAVMEMEMETAALETMATLTETITADVEIMEKIGRAHV